MAAVTGAASPVTRAKLVIIVMSRAYRIVPSGGLGPCTVPPSPAARPCPQFTGRAFTYHAAQLGLTHHRIPPRSPNHNSVCERVQGSVLQECYRPFFHRARVNRV